MRCAASEAHESTFECRGAGSSFEGGQGIAGEQASCVNHRDAIGEQLDLGQSVGSEEQGSIALAKNLGLQETAKFGGGDSVQTARGLI